MTNNRVVVTGLGLVSALGHTFDAVSKALQEGRSGVRTTDEWASYGVETKLGGFVDAFDTATAKLKFSVTAFAVTVG